MSWQAELGTLADGHIGPLTLGAITARVATRGLAGLIEACCDRRLGFLNGLKNFGVFGKGWTARAAAVRKAALTAAGETDAITKPSDNWRTSMDLLNGYKTYIVAIIMLLAGLAQVLGLDLPALDGHASGQMVMEALAILFLRKGLKTDISRA